MPHARRLAGLALLAALALPTAGATQTRVPALRRAPGAAAAAFAGPTMRLGALLPVTGPAAWYAQEIRQGLELGIAGMVVPPGPVPAVRPVAPGAAGAPGAPGTADAPHAPEASDAPADAPAAPGGEEPSAAETADPSSASPGVMGAIDSESLYDFGAPKPAPPKPPTAYRLVLDVQDVQPLNLKEATTDFGRLAASRIVAAVTASATPTLAIHPLAAQRDILVINQGVPGERFPTGSKTLLQARPAAADRTRMLVAYAWQRGIRRLALVSAGDETGKAVRAAASRAWRDRGAVPLAEDSLTLEAADVDRRLRAVTRLGPDAVLLGFQGAELGEIARRLREARYTGLLLALDDDRAALLAAGPALAGVEVLADAFVPEPDTRSERFAKAYQAKHGRPPSRFAAQAYDTVSLIGEAMRATYLDRRALPTGGEALRKAMLAVREVPSIFAGKVTLRDDGTLERPLALFTIDGGQASFVRYIGPDGRPVASEP
jgi:branched-chain amino acid transport system substrate-binding protein